MNHYETLQVARNADPEVIEKAYKALSMKHHPDRVSAEKRVAATARMQRINQAYTVLADREARRRYDATLPAGVGPSAWDTFMAKGLLGMLLERISHSRG